MSAEEFHIELKDLRFFSYHGLYPEEKKTGGEFLVNCKVSYRLDTLAAKEGTFLSLDSTVDYSALFEICSNAMSVPTELLENIAISIANSIRLKFPEIHHIQISITKIKPPIPGCTGAATVQYDWSI